MNRSSNSNDVNAQVEAIWTATRDEAARYVRRKLSGRADNALVDDAIAEATMRLHRHLSTGHPHPEDPAGWMCLVAWREYLRLLERRDRHYGGPLDDNIAADDSLAEVHDQLDRDALAQAFAEATDRLSDHQRAVIAEYAAGHTYKEVAERLDISLLAVNKALIRAKRALRKDEQLAEQVQAWRG